MESRASQEAGYDEFIRLFTTYRSPVLSYLLRLTGDLQTAEDLVQELFINLWQKRGQYDAIENKDQYIFRMAHNASMNWFRKVALDTRLREEMKLRVQKASNSVDDHVALSEAKALLEKAIETLSPQRKKVFELSRKQGLKLDEIAATLGISFHTANHHLVAALSQIREYFMNNSSDLSLILLAFLLVQ